MTTPSDHKLEQMLNSLGVNTNSEHIQLEKDVLISLARHIYRLGAGSVKEGEK